MNIDYKYPNILFVFSDQHRWCDLGCYGNPQVISPNFDAFSTKATQFNNCISNSPVCVPARGSILTGLFPLKHGAVSNDIAIKSDVESLATILGKQGYHTGYIGKWHLAGIPRDQYIPEGQGRLGFQEWKVANCSHNYMNSYYFNELNNRVEIDGYEPIEQTNLAVDFIRRNEGENPWGLVLSWSPPHDPYQQVPQKYLDLYENVDIHLRPNVPEVIQPAFSPDVYEKFNKYFCQGKEIGKHISALTCPQDRDQMVRNYKGYYAHITALDEQFGHLISTLEETGQLDNTVVVYTSDHGDMLGSQGTTNKQWPYEEAIKVPLLVYWKGKTIRLSQDNLISLVDLPVSLLGLVGLSFTQKVDGEDLHSLFTEKDATGPEDRYIFDYIPCHQAFTRGSNEWRGLRTKRYTFARSASDEGHILYDNMMDPYQMVNLINDPEYRSLKENFIERLNMYISKHDKLLTWEDFIREFGLKEEWNKSQAYFKLPLLV